MEESKKEDLTNYRPVNLTLITGKVKEQIILETTEIIESCQCGFLKGKFSLTNLIVFYFEMSGLVYKRRAVDVDDLDP